MTRGYAAVGLHNPKDPDNVGGVMRAAFAYGCAAVSLSGSRPKDLRNKLNTPRGERHMPTYFVDDVLSNVPHGCSVVAVEFVMSSENLTTFAHPKQALYVFGPEDGSLPADVLAKADHVVFVPTRCCMNLASTVNVVLYDRLQKQEAKQ